MVEQELRLAQSEFVPAREVTAPGEAGTSLRERATRAADRALKLAGLTLAPEQSELADPLLAKLLLSESFVRAVEAITQTELGSIGEARVAFAACDALPARFMQRGLAHAEELEGDAALDLDRLRKLEAWLVELLRFSRKGRRSRTTRRALAAVIVLVAASAALLLPRLYIKPGWTRYAWRTSSAFTGFARAGTLGAPLKDGLLLHTNLEREPWVVIDMNEVRSIREVIVENRRDCCFERALPLVVELSSDGRKFSLAGWKKTVFAEWTLSFEPREARYVRLRSEAETHLHLTRIAIR